ncbi:MAG: hypothetical protein QOD86_2943 [Miltoncostaeaceae bacterium]|jgi:uncharacterized membrane protein YqjE|nr:hypothetical protein [Miltoncostaeaceae bacterium]
MADTGNGDARDRSLGELAHELGNEAATLVRQEVELAKAELAQKASHAAKGAGMFGAAAAAGMAALGAFVAFVILALAVALPAWAAALIATGAFGAVAGGLALLGKKQVQEAVPPVPEQAIASVKEDIEVAKHARDGRTPVGSAS